MCKVKNFLENNKHLIYYREWKTKLVKPKGCIVLIHGMAEHIDRYSDFAETLLGKGYNVYGYDQRGHGHSAHSEETLGYVDKALGWNNYISDLKFIVEFVKKENLNEKVFLFAHSMGSFVARDYSIRYPNSIDGLILSGSADLLYLETVLGLAMSKAELTLRGSNKNAKNVDQFIGNRLNRRFKKTRTKFDWLSTDESEVDKYINDKLCGFCPKTSFYLTFFKGLIKLHEKSAYSKIPKNLPALLLTGEHDPVTNMALGTIRLFNKLKENGAEDVVIKIYEGVRHEILNDTKKLIVQKDIIDWINKH